VAPPELPAERLKMLRDAFNATMKDKDFVADTTKQKLDVDPENGEHLEALIKKVYATPKSVVDRIGELIK
jgi:tripartite-type tricarboxylate transporter receptor subunit TctC